VASTDVPVGEAAPRAILGGPAVVPFEIVPLAMLIADSSAEVLAVNTKWLQLSGLSTISSLGAGWLNVLDSESSSRLLADVRRVAASGSDATADYQWTSSPGRYTRWWLAPYGWAGQKMVGIAVAEVDTDQHPDVEPGLDELLGELPALFRNLEALLTTLVQLAVAGHI
jgi:hypothetical protein